MLSREWLRLILDTAAVNGWSEPVAVSAAVAASGSYFCIQPMQDSFVQTSEFALRIPILCICCSFRMFTISRERERGWQTDLEELLHVVVASPELADLGLAFRHQRLEPLLVPPVDCTRSELF
jgi:hypothetical protein